MPPITLPRGIVLRDLHTAVSQFLQKHRVLAPFDVSGRLDDQLDDSAMKALEDEAYAMHTDIESGGRMGLWDDAFAKLECFYIQLLVNGEAVSAPSGDAVYANGSFVVQLDTALDDSRPLLRSVRVVQWEHVHGDDHIAKLALQARALARGKHYAMTLYDLYR